MTPTIQFFDLAVNVTQALLWQYNKAFRLQSIVINEQDWYTENQTDFWKDWHRDVFDLRTANEFGCAVWSIILDMPLTVDVGSDIAEEDSWGFGEYRKNFNNGNFSSDSASFITPPLALQRTILRMRYFQLTSKGTVPEFNFFAREIFGPGVYVLDGLDMTAELIFQTAPSSDIKFILKFYDILPRPAGVGITYSVLTEDSFGFGPYRANFNNGNFRG